MYHKQRREKGFSSVRRVGSQRTLLVLDPVSIKEGDTLILVALGSEALESAVANVSARGLTRRKRIGHDDWFEGVRFDESTRNRD